MKKALPLCGLLLVAAASQAWAQSASLKQGINRAALRQARPVPVPAPLPADAAARQAPPAAPSPAALATPASWGRMLGQTTYDLQTNRSVGNRMAVTGNQISAVWTQTCQAGTAPNFPNRGVGYNGSTNGGITLQDSASHCASPFGIATVRTGWPEVMHINGQEVVMAHVAGAGTVRIARPIGSGSWQTSPVLPFTDTTGPAAVGIWPRAVTDGTAIHMVYVSNGSTTIPQQPSGVINPLLYARSPDGGLTWDRTNVNLPEFDSTNFSSVGGDNYAIAANGQHVAVTTGNFGNNTLLSISHDGGTTFNTVHMMGPFTAADTIDLDGRPGGDTATVIAADGSMSVVIDNSGTAHWFSGSQLVQVTLDRTSGHFKPTGSYFPDAYPGMFYWNDRELLGSKPLVVAVTDSFLHAAAPFTTLATGNNQSRQTYNVVGPISMPTAVTDANGDVYCIYANGMRGTSNDGTANGQYYRDLYLLKLAFPGNGTVLSYRPKNISKDLRGVPGGASSLGEESVFPSAAHEVVNGKIHYQWMSDFEPGTALQPTANADMEVENAIMYDTIGVTRTVFRNVARILSTAGGSVVVTGLAAAAPASADLVAVPNPTTGAVTLRLQLPQATTATVVVRNLLGQEVARRALTNLPAGTSALPLDLSAAAPGVYFCTVQTEGYSLTRRIVRQ